MLSHRKLQSQHAGGVRTANHLADRLRARIEREGPITFCEWMQSALYDEPDGYYCRTDLVHQGRAGDYRTAPETSPLFAATFVRYFTKSYLDLGEPRRWTIVEVGGGTGEFARQILTRLQTDFPRIFEATRYVLDEVSPDARAIAASKLEQFSDQISFRRLSEIKEPREPAIIFSNELIDAFPVHRVIGRNGKLKLLCVGLSETSDFVWVECDLHGDVSEYCDRIGLRLHEGQIFEVNLEAERFIARAAALIERGLLITVDYGASRDELLNDPNRFAGTLRAFRRHQMVNNVLADPGTQDLTTTIDWTWMQECGVSYGFENLRLERLDRFLLSEGLLEALLSASNRMTHAADVVNLQTGAREMIRPDGLAASFQVLIQRKDGKS